MRVIEMRGLRERMGREENQEREWGEKRIRRENEMKSESGERMR